MSQNKKYDVFISYSRKDTSIAREICRELEDVNITYFIDYNGILSGQDFINVIIKAINESSIFLFLASNNSYASQITLDEVFEALDGVAQGENQIITFIIDESELPKELKFRLRRYNWRKIKEHPIHSVLIGDILKLLGRERPNLSDSIFMKRKAEELSALGNAFYKDHCYEGAFENLKKAIKTGVAYDNRLMDFNTLGHMCQYGEGTDKDETEATSWYRRAAELGNANAQYNLGFMYYWGKGVQRDCGIAIKWFSLSTNLGNVEAQYALRFMYSRGEGLEGNMDDAPTGTMLFKNTDSNSLPINYVLRSNNNSFQILSKGQKRKYCIRYIAERYIETDDTSHTIKAMRTQYDVFEFYVAGFHHRNIDLSISSDDKDLSNELNQFLSLCSERTNNTITSQFKETSGKGWITFEMNNTYYLVLPRTQKSLPWSRIISYSAVSIGSVLIVVGAINIYNGIKEAGIKKRWEMSQRLTHAIATNNADSLRFFAEVDSVRAYLPYAKICLDNGDLEKGKVFVEKAEKTFPKDSLAILRLNVDIHEKESLILQQNEIESKEQAFDDLATTVNPESPAKEVTQTESKSDDELYHDAIRKSDWKILRNLADKGFSKAYIPLANHYANPNTPSTHHLADKYAQKAKKLGIAGADTIIKRLEIYEYY